MGFPEIVGCLVCEDVRGERFRKLSILGFYGLAPNVNIILQDLNKHIDRLSFLLIGNQGEGEHRLFLKILGNGGEVLVKTPEGRMKIDSPATRTFLTFRLNGLKFPKAGTYSVQLIVDDEFHYGTSFEISKGTEEDFA